VNRIGNVPYVGPNGRVNNVAGNAASPLDNIVGPNGETGVGWILDRTQSDLYPRFIQNGGLDFTNPNNYRPTVNGLSTQSGNLDIDLIKEARANFRYKLPIDNVTAFVKTGASIRDHTVELLRRQPPLELHRTDGAADRSLDPALGQGEDRPQIPMWEGAEFIQQGQPTNPALWQEDRYYYFNNRNTASNKVNEVITGYYAHDAGSGRPHRVPRRSSSRNHGYNR
jgi:hypothetical protein